jgi:hypothetical protein
VLLVNARHVKLDHLRPADLASFHSNIGVVGHILGLEGSNPVSPSFENPAEGSCCNGFTHITAGPQKHDGFGHFSFLTLPFVIAILFQDFSPNYVLQKPKEVSLLIKILYLCT